jgi:outer membrane protein assembly factor BamB
MMAIGDVVYIAYGPAVLAVDINEEPEEAEIWSYTSEDIGASVQLFAEPSVVDNSVVVGDYGDSGGFLNPRVTVGIYGLDDSPEQTPVPKEVWFNNESATDRIIASPLQIGDTVYVGTADNFMLALDMSDDGALLWQFETGKPVWSRPAYEDGVLYMGSMDGLAYALDADGSSERWSQDLGGAIAANIVFENGLIYVNSYNQSANALDPGTGEIIWSLDTSASVWGASAVSGDDLYLVDLNGIVYAVDAVTGELRWTEEIGELVQAGPAIGDGIVYVTTAGDPEVDKDERQGSLIALSTDDGEVLWQEQVPQPLYTTPLVVGDSVVVGLIEGSALLLKFDSNDGSPTWTFPRPGTESEE